MAPSPALDYAGDISAAEAWDRLKSDPKAQMVDVRTVAEWNFVGTPDLAPLGRRVHCVEWQSFPSGAPNPGFVDQASQALGADKAQAVLLICRSGARSRAAAIALAKAGFEKAFNVAGGFEGDPDDQGHRGNSNGWKASGLPWRQG
ncbi:MAG TPA: rhodanese-like domain-containing protein [Rhizomicrobium sp.]|jgi:rhodanese-related sulfurtransferase|nr:rhodanese-like domain-containing protein [Rhizomicrobium sp.]